MELLTVKFVYLKHELNLRFFMIQMSLGTPYNIIVNGLRLEGFFIADEASEVALRCLSDN